ncbi:two-component sensor histidine kinase [Rhizocola hellebori]|uniref:histidine kinase n=1 Tax=Rhizocola hellebori TaxID=1392758 RepID=A0A8J3QH53_9ACTN|nr:HAMP domain-containing sensor histidine kinase [Rhizocola hellebori]GIH09532.1 two-component sensor histidine kinase [Rhizocola hellebori]
MKAPRRWSLRARLLAGVLTLVAAGFTCAGVASVKLLGNYLTDRVDEQLRIAQQELVDAPLQQVIDASGRARVLSVLDGYVVQWRDPSGVLEYSISGPGQEGAPKLPTLDEATVKKLAGKPFHARNAGDYHDAGFRVLITERPDGQGSLVISYDFTETARTMGQFVVIELAVMMTVLSLSALLGVAMVRVGLRPLTEVEQTAEEIIAGGDLSRRVPELAAPGTEMGRLSSTLNTMLAEIEGSVSRLRRFVGDASHELRTPVTGIRGLAELYRQGAVTEPAEVAALVARIESEATRMGVLVEDLLLLARLDEERLLRSERVDLVPIVAEAIEGHPIDLELVGDEEPIVMGDEDRLHQVVTNLVTNALTHTASGTPITVRVGVDAGKVLLEVVDHGVGIPPEHVKRIFERFYRIDPARVRDHERSPATGAGLGLSIVAGIVTAHGGTVSIAQTSGGGATFRVELPLSE